MTHREAERLALELMALHGLTELGWKFSWSHGKYQLGVCQIRTRTDPRTGRKSETRTIKLSRYLVTLNNDAEVRDTILHEIAHALAGIVHGHDAVWREVCLRIGANPRRTAGREVRVVSAPYAIVCGRCSRDLAHRHRRPAAQRLAHSYCKHCGPQTRGKLRLIQRVVGIP